MFILVPYRVDVPYDRRPVANWLIFGALIFVFALQLLEHATISEQLPGEVRRHISEGHSREEAIELASESILEKTIYRFSLKGWTIRGLFGHDSEREESESKARTVEVEKTEQQFIRFRCQCGQEIKVPSQHAGKSGRCPKCSARLTVPEG